jgi:hypothetical protein
MDENPYHSPQTQSLSPRDTTRWPAGLYLLLIFVVVPILVATSVLVYRVATRGNISPSRHQGDWVFLKTSSVYCKNR